MKRDQKGRRGVAATLTRLALEYRRQRITWQTKWMSQPFETQEGSDGVTSYRDTDPYTWNDGHFIEMLAQAARVTIVGITNRRLEPMLRDAIERKRKADGREAFLDSLRIEFYDRELRRAGNYALAAADYPPDPRRLR